MSILEIETDYAENQIRDLRRFMLRFAQIGYFLEKAIRANLWEIRDNL